MKMELDQSRRGDALPCVQDSPRRVPAIVTRWLGRVNFADALELQEKTVAQKRADPSVADTILLLEHDAVYTIGRTPDQSSLRGGSHLPHPSFQINRGGRATYHGPGQLMGYPIIDLRRCGQDLHRYLRWIESLLIEFLNGFEIAARRREGLTGVWVQQRKIASIGVGVRHWITMHGFALNVCGDLSPFDHITPCGISNVTMTSIERETGKSVSVQDAAIAFATLVGETRAVVSQIFGQSDLDRQLPGDALHDGIDNKHYAPNGVGFSGI